MGVGAGGRLEGLVGGWRGWREAGGDRGDERGTKPDRTRTLHRGAIPPASGDRYVIGGGFSPVYNGCWTTRQGACMSTVTTTGTTTTLGSFPSHGSDLPNTQAELVDPPIISHTVQRLQIW